MVAAVENVLKFSSAKEYLNITVAAHDDELREFLAAAVVEVERFHDVAVLDRNVAESVDARSGQALLTTLPVRELTSVTAADASGRLWPVAGLTVSEAGVLYARSGAPLHGRLAVTYRAGMPEAPANFTAAVKLVLAKAWNTQRPGQAGARGGRMANSGGNNTGPTPMRRIVEDVLGATIPGIA